MFLFEKKQLRDKSKNKQTVKQPNIHRFRRIIQWLSLFLLNPYLILGVLGIMSLDVFRQEYQNMQVVFPVMNCYACPAAEFACPIGAIGNLLASGIIPFLVIGIFFVVGALVGKMFCGWICPFGLIQELFYKIPGKKIKLPKFTRYFKYFFLLGTVILIPLIWGTASGTGTPSELYFCNICPAAALEATIPQQVMLAADGTFTWYEVFINIITGAKFWILMFFIFLFIISKRPFCSTMCPIGAAFGLFNKFSFFKVKVNKNKCVSCSKCEQKCPIDHDIVKSCDSPECIRCLECEFEACGFDAIKSNLNGLRKPIINDENKLQEEK